MTHLGFIMTAYALCIGVPVLFALSAMRRLAAARRRLAAIDPRAAVRLRT
jgi:cytochrome c biogenesis protein CcdA